LRRSFPKAEVASAVGAEPTGWQPVVGSGYGSNTARWRVDLDDGPAVFLKFALDDLAAEWLRDEHRVYASVSADFVPRLAGWHDDGGRTLLVVEDLSGAYWPPPWTQPQIDAVLETLDRLHATPPLPGLPRLAHQHDRWDGWNLVAADSGPLVSTGLCSPDWLEAALPALQRASADCRLDGDAFLHFDVRSDNLCLRDGHVLLVDWNLACVGNPQADLVAWLPSLHLEGGPEPWEVFPDTGGLAAFISGYYASRAGLPTPVTAPRVREFQRRQAEVALPWAARELGLTLPL
jgi:Ser/Thr protein kinase RdoA (MazF antagonist)